MARRYFILVVACVFSVFLAATGGAADLVFDTQDFAPYSYMEGDQVAGPGVDMINAVCKEAGLNCSFKLMSWPRATNMVKQGEDQGLFFLGKNADREKWLEFSPPILGVEYGFFVRQDSPLQFKSASDVKGMCVGVYGPSNTSKTLMKIKDEVQGDLNVDMRPDDVAAFKKLVGGRVDAVFSNRDVGEALVKREGIAGLRYAGAYKELSYYIALSKEHVSDDVRKAFMDAYGRVAGQGGIDATIQKYGMKPAK